MDIEPDCQTALVDATQALPGVLASGVPGAGGEDALFALVLSPSARQRVEALWTQWAQQPDERRAKTSPASSSCVVRNVVCPLLLSAEHAGCAIGLRTHHPDDVPW